MVGLASVSTLPQRLAATADESQWEQLARAVGFCQRGPKKIRPLAHAQLGGSESHDFR